MAASDASVVALVMAGGSGTRFWPLSRADKPKQYLSLLGERSLIQQTIDRIHPLVPPERVYVCSAAAQRHWLDEQLPPAVGRILEPAARNTAPCLMLSAARLLALGHPPETAMVVLPADHFISRPESFRQALGEAVESARETKSLVLLGIVPDRPHTGYGYIESGEALGGRTRAVKRFVEKPDLAKARAFVSDPSFLWNSGIFIWTLGTIADAFARYLPAEWKALGAAGTEADLARVYQTLPSVAIDVAVLEKAPNRRVIPVEMGWSDVGSWDALHALRAVSPAENVALSGEVKAIESAGCLVLAPDRKVALVGVHDLIVVEDGEFLLVGARAQDQLVRQAGAQFAGPKKPD